MLMGYVIGDETSNYDLVFRLTGGHYKCILILRVMFRIRLIIDSVAVIFVRKYFQIILYFIYI